MQFNFISEQESEEINDILWCLRNLFSVPEGSMPLARGLGLKWSVLSDVPEDLENDFATDLVEKVQTFEPRVEVLNVEFTHDTDNGAATCNVEIHLVDSETEEEEENE
jgi:phage baseplate assembly protein W